MSETAIEGSERRSFVRIDTTLSVYFKIGDQPAKKVYTGATSNISRGGLCLQVVEHADELLLRLAEETPPMHIWLELADPRERIEVDAITRWSSSRIEWLRTFPRKRRVLYVGVAFDTLSDATKSKISYYMQQQESRDAQAGEK